MQVIVNRALSADVCLANATQRGYYIVTSPGSSQFANGETVLVDLEWNEAFSLSRDYSHDLDHSGGMLRGTQLLPGDSLTIHI